MALGGPNLHGGLGAVPVAVQRIEIALGLGGHSKVRVQAQLPVDSIHVDDRPGRVGMKVVEQIRHRQPDVVGQGGRHLLILRRDGAVKAGHHLIHVLDRGRRQSRALQLHPIPHLLQ